MSGRILSIDMRDNAISAILIKSGIKGNHIEAHCSVRFDQAPADVENSLFWALSCISDQVKAPGATCLFSVPPSWVTYRNIKVPFRERKKIQQMLPMELESGLAVPVDCLTIDFDIVQKGEFTDVIAAAVKTEALDEAFAALQHLNITPQYITTGPVAEALCLVRAGKQKWNNFLFISIDEAYATICMVFSQKLYLARTFPLPQADPGQRAGRLVRECLRLTASFETIYDFDCRFDQVALSFTGTPGDDETKDAFASPLTRAFETNVRRVDIRTDANLKLLSYPQDADFGDCRINSTLCLAAIEISGIAPFNFLREHYFFRKYLVENKTELVSAGILFVIVFLLIMAHSIIEIRFLESRVQEVNREITEIFQATLSAEARMVDPVHQMETEISRMREQSDLSGNPGADIANIEILRAINSRIPDNLDMLITSLVRSDENVVLTGTLDTFNAVDEVKGRLEGSELFDRITISSANLDSSINRIRFRIRADLAVYGRVNGQGNSQ